MAGLHAAKSSILYSSSTLWVSIPWGRPVDEMRRKRTLEISQNKSDDELLNSMVELSPRLNIIDRQYSRLGGECLRVSVSGEKEFTISR